MPLLKTTWIMQIARHSFSESWYRSASSPDPKIELIAAKQYAVARAALLGFGSYIYAIRISNVEDRRQKAYLEYVNYPGNQQVDDNGVPIHGSAASNVALNMEFNNVDNTQEKLIQLRGIWDDVETVGGSWNFTDPVYVPLIQAYGLKLVQLFYGWRYTSTVQKSPLSGYTVATNGLITFSTINPIFTLDQVSAGRNVACRISENVSSRNLNGAITLLPLSTTSGRSIVPIAAAPWIAGGKLQRNVLSFTTATDGRVQRVGNRQAGAPLLQSAGRGPVRARG